jgi:hypothetical protein
VTGEAPAAGAAGPVSDTTSSPSPADAEEADEAAPEEGKAEKAEDAAIEEAPTEAASGNEPPADQAEAPDEETSDSNEEEG